MIILELLHTAGVNMAGRVTNYLTHETLSHGQRVRRLYKAALRTLQSYSNYRCEFRYHAVCMRERFDATREECHVDQVRAKILLEEGEKELYLKQHPQPIKFPNSAGGIAYGREAYIPDWVLDMWHPIERLQYPEYFEKREQRKKEYIARWENKYGKAAAE